MAMTEVDELLAAGDIGGAIRQLRFLAETAPAAEVAERLRVAGAQIGFDDIVAAADAVLADPQSPAALYDLGYACMERGIPAIAIPMLNSALERAPGERVIVTELAVAYEDVYRYADAVAVLEANAASLRDWPDRYLLAFNCVMSGDLDRAGRYASSLSTPDDGWAPARDRLTGMLERGHHCPDRTVRGWHYILNASVLGSISPYGYDEGMNGRYAFTQDSPDRCARTLRRFATAVPELPATVSLLPDRSSRILGLAAATLFERPTVEWQPDRADTVVVAYSLAQTAGEVLPQLRNRPSGSIVLEHATCWTDPPPIAAEFAGLLYQTIVPPWGSRLVAPPDGEPYRSEPDARSDEVLAAEIVAADPSPDEVAPGDDDQAYAAFVASLHGVWPPVAPQRDRLWSPGPIGSSYFS